MNIENPDEILEWDLAQLWNAFKQIREDSGKYLKEEHQIKFGIKLNIPIWYILNEWYTEKPKSAEVVVKGFGVHNLYEFHDEVENREVLIRKILYQMIDSEMYGARV